MTAGCILYVEDNFDNRLLIRRVLMAEGYEVVEAESGLRGLELAQTCSPDLVLMDINLPDIDGYDCTARMREMDALKEVPILALTANVLEGDRRKALRSGCNGFIAKPVDIDELPRQVSEHIKKKGKAPSPPANGTGT